MKNAVQRGGKWNRLKTLWREDRVALGVLATTPSAQTVQIIARSGVDFILIDMEHGAIDANAAHAMIAATQGTSLLPLVRVGAVASWLAKVPLDLGALGVCFPMTNTRASAEACVKAVRYPPEGERFWGRSMPRRDGQLRSANTRKPPTTKCCRSRWQSMSMSLTPSPRSSRRLDLDMIFIGPGDLATSMGGRGNVADSKVGEVIGKLEPVIRDSPVVLGGVATNPSQAKEMIARGYQPSLSVSTGSF